MKTAILALQFVIGVLAGVVIFKSVEATRPQILNTPEHWSKWSAANHPYSEWNGALQYRTNLDTGLIEVRNIGD